VPDPPLVVVEGASAAVERACRDAAADGWRVVEDVREAGPGTVWRGVVDGPASAGQAVLAAVSGAGVVVAGTADREVLDRLCDDLRRLGRLDHRLGEPAQLSDEEAGLLAQLLAGASLGEAARRLHLSRRTADRRLAAARRALGATSTPQALVLAAGRGVRPAEDPAESR
jgi:DNA-binding CsgD family transcriptional regulator